MTWRATETPASLKLVLNGFFSSAMAAAHYNKHPRGFYIVNNNLDAATGYFARVMANVLFLGLEIN